MPLGVVVGVGCIYQRVVVVLLPSAVVVFGFVELQQVQADVPHVPHPSSTTTQCEIRVTSPTQESQTFLNQFSLFFLAEGKK